MWLGLSAAAFRRLCVETSDDFIIQIHQTAAAFRRLCVETELAWLAIARREAAAFRRLCVETLALNLPPEGALRSRLQAAVC